MRDGLQTLLRIRIQLDPQFFLSKDSDPHFFLNWSDLAPDSRFFVSFEFRFRIFRKGRIPFKKQKKIYLNNSIFFNLTYLLKGTLCPSCFVQTKADCYTEVGWFWAVHLGHQIKVIVLNTNVKIFVWNAKWKNPDQAFIILLKKYAYKKHDSRGRFNPKY